MSSTAWRELNLAKSLVRQRGGFNGAIGRPVGVAGAEKKAKNTFPIVEEASESAKSKPPYNQLASRWNIQPFRPYITSAILHRP